MILLAAFSFTSYFHFGLLEIPVLVFAVGYAVCGSMITYYLIKFSLRKLKDQIINRFEYFGSHSGTTYPTTWNVIKDAAKGKLAITGGAIYSVFSIMVVFVYSIDHYGIEKGSAMYSLLLCIATVASVTILRMVSSKKNHS